MNITIVGGGNIGTQFAVHCAEKGHQVTVFGNKPEKFCKHLEIVDKNGNVTHEGDIVAATGDPQKAFSEANIIFVTMPAFCMEKNAKLIEPFAKKGMKIGLIPGTGGGECAFRKCIEKGAVLFGLQRVPGVARLKDYGKKVCATGYRKELHIAALPRQHAKECSQIINSIFDMPCIEVPYYLNLTLTPSNPILHTTRLKTIFEDYHIGIIYNTVPLFYEEWDDKTSELLLKCDSEVQNICKKLSDFDLKYVKSLRLHYESETPEQLTKKISGIEAFKGLKTPVCFEKNGLIPDLHSRYFTADFSYGLSILVQIADIFSISIPNMKETLHWYHRIALERKEFQFCEYGIKNAEDFRMFYKL